MIRGTTPTIRLKAKFDLRNWNLYVTLKQGLVEYTFENGELEVDFDDGFSVVSFMLTQGQTLSFNENNKVEIQLRAAKDDSAIASKVATVDVYRILKGGVIDG